MGFDEEYLTGFGNPNPEPFAIVNRCCFHTGNFPLPRLAGKRKVDTIKQGR